MADSNRIPLSGLRHKPSSAHGRSAAAKTEATAHGTGIGNQQWLHATRGEAPLPHAASLMGSMGRRNDPFEQRADAVAPQTSGERRARSFPLQRRLISAARADPGAALDANIREQLPPTFGNLSEVRVHTDASAAAASRALNAFAFTIGRDMYFAQGAFAPSHPRGAKLLAHELTHVAQNAGSAGTPRKWLSDPADAAERDARSGAVPTTAPSALVQRQETPTETTDPGAVEAPSLTPEAVRRVAYARTVLQDAPRLSPEQEATLDRAIGGSHAYRLIHEKNANADSLKDMRETLSEMTPEHGVSDDPLETQMLVELQSAIEGLERRNQVLEHDIMQELLPLGVSSEEEFLELVDERFPRFFLERARQIVFTMLDDNRAVAERERARYAEQVCSPDIEGLLEADRRLAQLKQVINSTRISIDLAHRYMPSAGIPETPEEYGLPPHMQSVMVDIARLSENQQRLPQLEDAYKQAFNEEIVKFPILGARDYEPGTFSNASYEDLVKVTGGVVDEVIENIDDVRKQIDKNNLKLWNLENVIELTMLDLGIQDNEVLTAAVQAHIAREEADESFLHKALVALAITTTLIAGMLGTPLLGTIVGAAWGTYFLATDIAEYRRESSAEYVSFDPEFADISIKEPTLTWIVLDVVFLGLDASTLVRGLRPFARALTATRSAEDFAAFARATRAALPEGAAEGLLQRVGRRFGLPPPPPGAVEIRLPSAQYLQALGHAFPELYFDEALRAIDDLGRATAADLVRDGTFLAAVRRASANPQRWNQVGTAFHNAAAVRGRQLVQAGLLPPGWVVDFELTVQSGRGGSRLDVFLRGPAGEAIEIDWKTTGRSAMESVEQMEKHARQIADPRNPLQGVTLTGQRSISWIDEIRAAWEEFQRADPAAAQRVFGGPITPINWPAGR